MTADAADADEPYLIWSHEHGAWWAPGSHGYVAQLSAAGHYPRRVAVAICAGAIPGNASRAGALFELPVRLADVLAMQARYRSLFFATPPEVWE
jgi:hypothetical protein